jgi:hypothetical protein
MLAAGVADDAPELLWLCTMAHKNRTTTPPTNQGRRLLRGFASSSLNDFMGIHGCRCPYRSRLRSDGPHHPLRWCTRARGMTPAFVVADGGRSPRRNGENRVMGATAETRRGGGRPTVLTNAVVEVIVARVAAGDTLADPARRPVTAQGYPGAVLTRAIERGTSSCRGFAPRVRPAGARAAPSDDPSRRSSRHVTTASRRVATSARPHPASRLDSRATGAEQGRDVGPGGGSADASSVVWRPSRPPATSAGRQSCGDSRRSSL